MMRSNGVLITLVCLFCMEAQAQVQKYFDADCFKHASYAMCVVDLSTQQTKLNINDQKSLTPASTLKIISTSTSLLLYGSDYRFVTPIYYSGVIADSVLSGDVVVVATGDPTLGSFRFPNANIAEIWAAKIKALGIRQIKGKLIVDLSQWSRNYAPMEWLWGDLGNYYGAAFSALTYRENTYTLTLESKGVGDSVTVKSVSPQIPELQFDCRLKGANDHVDNAYILGSPLSSLRQIVGTIPAHKTAFTIKGSIPFPALLLLNDLSSELNKEGIRASGIETIRAPYANKVKLIDLHQSPSLLEITQITNLHSHNLFAETLAQQCNLKLNDTTCTEFSHDGLVNFWKQKGVNTDGVLLYDGCGLSPRNLVTARFLVDVLVKIKQSSIASDFISTLPVAGKSGTARSFLSNTALTGKVIAKSGSMGGVRSYAGFILKGNKTYAFSIIVNNFTVKDSVVVKEIEHILTRMYSTL